MLLSLSIINTTIQVFYLRTRKLMCFDALSGKEMFRIKSMIREKKNLEEAEEKEKKEDQEETDHCTADENDQVEENPRKRLRTEADDQEEKER